MMTLFYNVAMNKKYIPLVILLLLLAFSAFAYFYAKNSADILVDFHKQSYTGANKCKACHADNYKSWHKTYHSSMTQEANAKTVLGDFDGSNQTYWGLTIVPNKKDGNFFFDYYDPQTGKFLDSLQIKRTVGSRRYQQYLAQTPNTQGNYYRLELLWHIEDQRWVHLNGVFLGSDHQAFSNHTAIWNQNCIFCHNTGIVPNMTNYDEIIEQTKAGKPLNLKVDSRFESQVADLGIGCESCHGTGDKHIELNQNPLRKYYLHYSKADDKSIINPAKLSAKRSMDVCGQCHGQRTPKTYDLARKWMETGPTYRPGDALQSHVNPVWQASMLNNSKSDTFSQRFWQDGTPRLSAYEYQGILQSQCHKKGELTCNDCHTMHEGNPKGMIKDEMLTNHACTTCHKKDKYNNNIALHTKHKANSDGSLCYNCHMPKIVYGIMTFHRSHKIESPNTKYELAHDKPNACAACHVDKTNQWLLAKTNELWQQPNNSSKHQQTALVQSLYKLHSGDPVERAIAATNLGYEGDLYSPRDKLFVIPHLLFAMSDNYPAIRRFAFKSLQALLNEIAIESAEFTTLQQKIKAFDFIADAPLRNRVINQIWQDFNEINKTEWRKPPADAFMDNDYNLDKAALLALRKIANQDSKKIEIGE